MLKTSVIVAVLVAYISGIACGEDTAYLLKHFEDVDTDLPNYGQLSPDGINDVLRSHSMQISDLQQREQERVRSNGRSGIKQVRNDNGGTNVFYTASHGNRHVAGIHDHVNNIITVGAGEFVFVLNGVEARARHNDFRLLMPRRKSDVFGDMEEIPLPGVPPEVTNMPTIDDQIDEMRMWFKAFATQNTSLRDYPQYFRPVLCYLEGYWIEDMEELKEADWSDRHFKDAKTWFEMFETNRFLSYTGAMKINENIVFLPKVVNGLKNNRTVPILVQFDYRMLCHPIKRDIPLNRFKLVEDLGIQMALKIKTPGLMPQKPAARFRLNPLDQDKWADKYIRFGLLDELMYDIPGLDNRPTNIRDTAFGCEYYNLKNDTELLDASRYHRWYALSCPGDKKKKPHARFFSDDSCYVAYNNQKEIAKQILTTCTGRLGSRRKCSNIKQSTSYAFPFEIIYTNPLSNWNPFNITFKGRSRVVTEGKRKFGKFDKSTAFNGSSETTYYITPVEFYTGEKVGQGKYKHSHGDRGVLDPNGDLKYTRASGHYILMPQIPGIKDRIRTRWPIMPVHGEGSTLWKEVEALKKVLLKKIPNLYDL